MLCVPSKNGANILPGCMNGNNGRGFLADLRRITDKKVRNLVREQWREWFSRENLGMFIASGKQ